MSLIMREAVDAVDAYLSNLLSMPHRRANSSEAPTTPACTLQNVVPAAYLRYGEAVGCAVAWVYSNGSHFRVHVTS